MQHCSTQSSLVPCAASIRSIHLSLLQSEHKLEINMISSGSSIVYSFFGAKAKLAERLKKPVSEVVKEVSKACLPGQGFMAKIQSQLFVSGTMVSVPFTRARGMNPNQKFYLICVCHSTPCPPASISPGRLLSTGVGVCMPLGNCATAQRNA